MMAKYKEQWEHFDDATIIGYEDTEYTAGARCLPADSQEVADWIALGNTPDPAYTQAEIDALTKAQEASEALNYVRQTDKDIDSYTERKAAKLPGRVNSLKFKSLQRKRAVALGRV
jgi:hypothetical protein